MARAPAKSAAKSTAAPKPKPGERHTPISEWIAAGLGLIIVLASFGFVAADLFKEQPAPPAFATRTTSVTQSAGVSQVQVEVSNTGDLPAGEVIVEGVVGGGAQSSQATIDFIAGRSSRTVGLIFAPAISAQDVTISVRAYTAP